MELNRFTRWLSPFLPRQTTSPTAEFQMVSIETFRDFKNYVASSRIEERERRHYEVGLLKGDRTITVQGMCHVCGKKSKFKVDFLYSDPQQLMAGQRIPNWRERLLCESCKLNSRIRCSIHFLEAILCASPKHRIYITEQLTPLYEKLAGRYPYLTGSEYLGETIPYGTTDPSTGVRNESLTKLTFPDGSFDYLLSFDVLEHIPDYLAAARECFRCLKSGGTLLFSAPFDVNSEPCSVRARIGETGEVEHLLPPEYHSDPVRDEGVLCFYHFGWAMLAELRSVGFTSVAAHLLWSERFAYLGNGQVLFSAVKPGSSPII